MGGSLTLVAVSLVTSESRRARDDAARGPRPRRATDAEGRLQQGHRHAGGDEAPGLLELVSRPDRLLVAVAVSGPGVQRARVLLGGPREPRARCVDERERPAGRSRHQRLPGAGEHADEHDGRGEG